jgi:putative membrane protein insertion efficiency factor
MLARTLLLMIRGYQRGISPFLPPACRYTPTCSDYAAEAIRRHGSARGSWLAARRLLRCHPWGGSGFDPVP